MIQLTDGAVANAFAHNPNQHFDCDYTMQVINMRSVPTPNGQTRYRAILSDGTHFVQSMFSQGHSQMIDDGSIKRGSIIHITEGVLNTNNTKKIFICLTFTLVSNDFEERIGTPVNIEGVVATKQSTTTPAASEQSQNQMPLFMQNSGSSYAINTPNMELEANLFPIKGLNPYQNKWVIKARVTQKSEIKHWSNARSEGKLFSVNLLDQSGEIKATAFKDQVDRLYPLMEEGRVYYVSRARVTMAKKQFSTLNNEYELSFDHTTEVELCADEQTIPEMNYNFVKIADMDKQEKGSVVDVVGVVREDTGVQEIISKASGRPAKKRELAIVDETQKQIRVTIWESAAENFDASGTPIVAFKGLRVGDFNGRSLSLSSSGTLKRDPVIPEAQKLGQWYKTQGQSANYTNFTNSQSTEGGSLQPRDTPKMTIQEAKDKKLGESESADYFITRATIMYIKNDNYSYPACPECRKKLIQETEGWRCEKCQQTFAAPEYKYVLGFSVEDSTSHLYLNCFDEVGAIIMKKSANEMATLRETDDAAFRNVFTAAAHKIYNFKIKAMSQVFNDSPRTKYQVLEVTPVDFAREGQELAAAIDKLLI